MRAELTARQRAALVRMLVSGAIGLVALVAVSGQSAAVAQNATTAFAQTTDESEPAETTVPDETEESVPVETTVPEESEPEPGPAEESEPGGVSTATWVGAIALLVFAVAWATHQATKRTSPGDEPITEGE